MTAFEQLPPDERAVLQLVLQRGRGYDDIAQLLAIDRAAVRGRALAGLDALGPETRVSAARRALITDYLLSQLPPRVSAQVLDRLAESAGERAWARVVAAEIAPIARAPLPEIPVQAVERSWAEEPGPSRTERVARGASSTGGTGADESASGTRAADDEAERSSLGSFERRDTRTASRGSRTPSSESARTTTHGGARLADGEGTRASTGLSGGAKRSSRTGGALLLALLGLAVLVAIVIALTSGGGNDHSSTSASASTPTAPSAAGGATVPAGRTVPRTVAQFSLNSTVPGSRAKGVVAVLRAGSKTGVAIVATGLPPNSKHPPNDYAVWLYNSPSDSQFVGFVSPGVGASGRLTAAGGLQPGASRYRELVVTLETSTSKPKAPGRIVLSGRTKGL